MKLKKIDAKNALFSGLQLPHLIQIYGNRKVVFEDCRRVLEYSDTEILLEGRSRVLIRGKGLELCELGGGNLAAVGTLTALEFNPEMKKAN